MNMGSKKRGQVTLFVIIAIVIVAAFLAGFLLYQNSHEKNQIKANAEIAPVKEYIEICLKYTAVNGIKFIGMQGGYYHEPENYFAFEEYAIPYYSYEGKKQMPSKEIIGQELSSYIRDNIDYCLDNFSLFNKSFNISAGKNVFVNSKIIKESVIINLNLPVIITKRGEKFYLENFTLSLDYDLFGVYDTLQDIVEIGLKNPLYTNDALLLDLLKQSGNFSIIQNPITNQVVLFVFLDNSTKAINLFNNPYTFQFVSKYLPIK